MIIVEIILVIISLATSVLSLLGTLNKNFEKNHNTTFFDYILKDLKVVYKYLKEAMSDIFKSFSEGLFEGIFESKKLLIETVKIALDIFINSFIRTIKVIFSKKMIAFVSKMIYLVLFLSTMWTGYFLYMGLLDRENTEYYSNISSMIVSVATMFSILVGFYEFRKK
ncbi:hypothetical protein [Enterococcus casseliflavus]|uniref:hypothetical protein n=1 Tax=Enterococcus casseliflavus TaxID=37734 RepID=UPI003D0D3FC2